MRRWILWVVLAFAAGALASAAWAAENQPASSMTAPTPQIKSSQGSIAEINLVSPTPWFKVSGANGESWTFMLDAKTSSVWQNGQLLKESDLKVGEQVKVRHTSKEGKEWAKSIEIVQASAPLASPAAPERAPVEPAKSY